MKIRIATRKSALALVQTNHVKKQLLSLDPTLDIELLELTTEGDQKLDQSLAKIGGKGLFIKELEQALLDGRADIAVHSMKDVPMELPSGLTIAAILKREDPSDAFVSCNYSNIEALPQEATVGTSSLRRQSQLLAIRPDLNIKLLRGNVPTRVKKLEDGQYDAIILATAGLKRLGLTEKITARFSAEEMLPAVGQGAVGIECRSNDSDVIALVSRLIDNDTAACVMAERAVSRSLNASCHLPLAAFATIDDESHICLKALVSMPDASRMVSASEVMPVHDADKLGVSVAKALLSEGADDILKSC